MRLARALGSFGILCVACLLVCSPAVSIESTKLTVQVNSSDTGKPIDRASVLVRFRHGRGVNLKKILTSWETKTNQEGNVTIPAIPQGQVTIQVIAENYQTYGNVYELDEPQQTVTIKLNPPQSQYSEDAKTPTVPKAELPKK